MIDFKLCRRSAQLEREGYGNKAKDFIPTKDFTGKN